MGAERRTAVALIEKCLDSPPGGSLGGGEVRRGGVDAEEKIDSALY